MEKLLLQAAAIARRRSFLPVLYFFSIATSVLLLFFGARKSPTSCSSSDSENSELRSMFERIGRLESQGVNPSLASTQGLSVSTTQASVTSETALPSSTALLASSRPAASSGQRLFDHESATALASIAQSRAFTASGFDFCSILNNASFDALVHITPLGGSVAEVNPTEGDFVRLLDREAKRAYDLLMNDDKRLEPE
ncbi:hypothetical protein BDK51DRAFT_26359, partial [Blyttiomyces helicus]